ncbi:MAG: toll/interleukin-1 receptor domain-containing protein [Gemmatimonadaceae bacterium]|nr:toll/interleukin-1 receptor domain-containing protein [Gemmatimonadaceae bacterium]
MAMPLIATGDQQRSISEVVPVLLEVLTRHMRLGSALGRAVIAVHDAMSVPTVREAIRQFRSRATVLPVVNEHEVFISYQHGSVNEIDHFLSVVRSARPRTSVWMDRERLKPGHGWNSMIAGAIDGAKIFVPFYSRQYFSSMICQEELAAAHIRRRALRSEFILPVLLDDVALSSYLQVTQFKDARINNKEKLTEAAHSLAARLDARTTTFAPLRDFN